jgi:hypothetical protein
VLTLGHGGKQIRNTLNLLKCGAGEGWRRMEKDGEGGRKGLVQNVEVLQRVEQERHIVHTVT